MALTLCYGTEFSVTRGLRIPILLRREYPFWFLVWMTDGQAVNSIPLLYPSSVAPRRLTKVPHTHGGCSPFWAEMCRTSQTF